MREATIERNTNETQIKLTLNLDGTGKNSIKTPIKFFNHMLEQFSSHGHFDVYLEANSIDSDPHHTVEDVAIVLGSAILKALGDKKGIKRFAHTIIPMDEALAMTSIDISGRAFCNIETEIPEEKINDFDTILVKHFFQSFAANSLTTIHIKQVRGDDSHHIVEAIFKSFARTLALACEIDEKFKDITPSTKGVL